MGKHQLNAFAIRIKHEKVYHPGDVVEGHVTVGVDPEMKVKGIRLEFCGDARVHWTEQRSAGGRNRKKVRHFRATENYFYHQRILFGKASEDSDDDETLPKGRHSYPFRFRLPPDIPSTFESLHGRIRYCLTSVIDMGSKVNHLTKKAITVSRDLDLDTVPMATKSGSVEKTKRLCCLCCKSGPICFKLQLDRCGYVPGESIPIKGEISNLSRRTIKRSYVALCMTGHYYATNASIKASVNGEALSMLTHGEIRPGESDSWTGELLPVPPTPPSKLPGCSIIDTSYCVKMCVEPKGVALTLNLPIDIIIGTVPLTTSVQNRTPSQNNDPDSDHGSSVPLEKPARSYKAWRTGEVSLHDGSDGVYDCVKEEMKYTPKYVYYRWKKPSSSDPQDDHVETEEEPLNAIEVAFCES